ncbi:hypothetical protein C0J52_00390 [Blattella germanica]|nr:hypothetical protein C0J52_00390 [Blattella germanica]
MVKERRLSSTRGLRRNGGWIRVYSGLRQEGRGTLVFLQPHTTTREVCQELSLGDDVSICLQGPQGRASGAEGGTDDPRLDAAHIFGFQRRLEKGRLAGLASKGNPYAPPGDSSDIKSVIKFVPNSTLDICRITIGAPITSRRKLSDLLYVSVKFCENMSNTTVQLP